MYLSTETSTVPGDRIDSLYSVLGKEYKWGDKKKKVEEVGKGEWKVKHIHRPNKKKKGENTTTVMKPLAVLTHHWYKLKQNFIAFKPKLSDHC